MAHWTAENIPSLAGRTFIVTGANSGLGLVTTRELLRHGAYVVMTSRNDAKGQEAAETLRAEIPDARVDVRHLDTSDMDSVREFANKIIADQLAIDVLINNAGIMMTPRSLTSQGFELQFATNHLGHFALTGLLFNRLKAGRDPRVVTVTSDLHKGGSIHFDDLTGERRYSPVDAYKQSKFANVLFGLELDRRLRNINIPMKSVLAHPGYSATNLQSTGPTGWMKMGMKISNRIFAQSAEMGTLCQLFAATDPSVDSGQFIGPDGRGEKKGYPTIVQPAKSATDEETARRLWGISEELTGVQFDV